MSRHYSITFSEKDAKAIAADYGPGYRARRLRGQWYVWCDASNHYVEVDTWSPCVTAIGTDHDGVEFD